MPTDNASSGLDRPWHRPGAGRYAWARLRGILRPPVTVFDPEPGTVTVERDVAVAMRDGTILRVNVHRSPGGEPAPVLMSAHPYHKDTLPRRTKRRAHLPFQYRLMRSPSPIAHSTLTSWEAPDPLWWVQQGYVVLNCDLRGAGTSDGVGALLSDREGEDIYDLIEWAATRPWSTGRVGLLGVSYLAMSQYKAAALNPPSLKAFCPWEGLTDLYRDLMRPGGLLEDGFVRVWTAGTRRVARLSTDIGRENKARPLRDQWWQSLVADLSAIHTPMLVCASFSDNNVHSRGSFRAFEQVGSAEKFAYTHRGGKWSTFYGTEAKAAQLAFFQRYLRGADVAAPPRVRLEVREDRDHIVAVRAEATWPLEHTDWHPLYLSTDNRLTGTAAARAGHVTFHTRRDAAAFTFTTEEDVELTGPMVARLWVQVEGADDVDLYVGVEKWRGSQFVGFEGSFGYGRDRVTTGWQKASLRELDSSRCTPGQPVHTFRHSQPLNPGEIFPVVVGLGPSATLFRAGESLRLVVAGRWLFPRNPLTGQFPGHYRRGPAARCTLHWGPEHPAHLLVPRIPQG
ncbi:MAG: CocE/NonD family hydrolase [Mycobacteriaceae bacterium]